jgi:glycosyltransferase involved in cell wall biosynthesis
VRILQLNAVHTFGGAETVARQLHAACAAEGHESVLLVAHGRGLDRRAGERAMYPAPLERLRTSRLHRFAQRWFPPATWTDRVARRLGDAPWDVIHVHNFHGDYATIETLGGLARRRPVVWTFHGCWGFTGGCDHTGGCERYQAACGACPLVGRWAFLETDDTREQLQRKMRAFAAAPFHVVSPSRWLATRIRGSQVGARWATRVIPNGVDTARFRPDRMHDPSLRRSLGLSPDSVVVLIVNRNFQDATKGFETARAALAATATPGVEVVLAGLNGAWAAASLPGVTAHAPGFVASPSQLASYYEVADVLLFTSPEENFPCAVLEAMAAGCCVVATPTAGVQEQVEDGRSGLIAPGFAAGDVVGVLRAALASPALRHACGAAARERAVHEFSIGRMTSSYIALYQEAAAAWN